MKTYLLPTIRDPKEEYDRLEEELIKLWRKELYIPLLREAGLVEKQVLQNAKDDLSTALQKGRINFAQGTFRGKFSAQTSRELKKLGAKWDKKAEGWKLPLKSLPPELKQAVRASESKFMETLKRLDQHISKILPEKISDLFQATKIFDTTLFKVNRSFQKSVSAISIPAPELSEESRKEISKGYNDNMKLWIKDWTEQEIKKLRADVSNTYLAGNRREALAKTIQKSYGESVNKAKFLARQETNLLVSKFKQERYKAAGVEEYIWKCVAGSPAHPVRPMHKKLDGSKQRWDNPPIVDEKGNRKHPGEDFNCRCYPRPIVRF